MTISINDSFPFGEETELMINRVIEGEATDAECEQFHSRVRTDPAFSKHVDEVRSFLMLLRLPEVQDEIHKSSALPRQRRYPVFSFAASIAVSLVLGWALRGAVEEEASTQLVTIAEATQTLGGVTRSSEQSVVAEPIPSSTDTAVLLPLGPCKPTSLTVTNDDGHVVTRWEGDNYPGTYFIINVRGEAQPLHAVATLANCPGPKSWSFTPNSPA